MYGLGLIVYGLPYLFLNEYMHHEYTNRILSSINSISLTIASLVCYYNISTFEVLKHTIYFNINYFIIDSFYIYYTNYKNPTIDYIHHFVCTAGPLVFMNYINQKIIVILYLSEMTTILVNLSWYLNKKNLLKKYKLFTVFLYTSLIILWLKYRIYNIIQVYYILEYKYYPIPSSLLAMNIYWLFKIVVLIYKHINGEKKQKD